MVEGTGTPLLVAAGSTVLALNRLQTREKTYMEGQAYCLGGSRPSCAGCSTTLFIYHPNCPPICSLVHLSIILNPTNILPIHHGLANLALQVACDTLYVYSLLYNHGFFIRWFNGIGYFCAPSQMLNYLTPLMHLFTSRLVDLLINYVQHLIGNHLILKP